MVDPSRTPIHKQCRSRLWFARALPLLGEDLFVYRPVTHRPS